MTVDDLNQLGSLMREEVSASEGRLRSLIRGEVSASEQRITDRQDRAVETIIGEMDCRCTEVNQRLERMDATLGYHAKQFAAGARSIRFIRRVNLKGSADYTHLLAELARIQARVACEGRHP